MTVAARTAAPLALAPFSLRDAPSFIERQFPVGRLSAEAFKERTAKQAQTLTALVAYWKGRKPLILVRAVVLGCLLPTTDEAAADLDIFLRLMAMDDAAFGRRFDKSAAEFARTFPAYAELATEERGRRRVWRDDLGEAERQTRVAEALASVPYTERVAMVRRPEECDEAQLLAPVWGDVNRHLGTNARSLPQLVEQLGIARYGHRPKVADTLCGGGSIPFEAARLGCDVYASDLNPVACMLTWGAFNIVGASRERRAEIEAAQKRVAVTVDAEITRLGIEHDANGNRAKNYLYVLETRCPRTNWMVPMTQSWVITKDWNVVGQLVPDPINKRYDIEICTGVSMKEMAEAELGTVRDGRLVHPMNPERSGVEIKTIRGDYRDAHGVNRNRLRQWERSDFARRPDDIFQERLYCIQWITKNRASVGRSDTFFAGATNDDYARERKVETVVRENLSRWQEQGIVPDMPIEPGDETTRLYRERGWTHWHHLFSPRQLLFFAILQSTLRKEGSTVGGPLDLFRLLDRSSKLPKWSKSNGSGGQPTNVFDNQALNPQINYGTYASTNLLDLFVKIKDSPPVRSPHSIAAIPAPEFDENADIFLTDPPYADAINYHEITEFFIAWLRKNPPPPFDQWSWDAHRDLAIKGKDEQFRRDMVAAYGAMTRQMPEDGLQVVMFTHQDAGVWADLGAILWAAGLQVTAAWNVVTETEKPSGTGNYVQGTVCLVLRKRLSEANARRMEIEAEIEEAVAKQLARLTALDDSWHERSNAESLSTDGDLTLAAYAAALQVVTAYSSIDRQPLDRDLYRKLAKGETTMLRDLISYAESVANNLLVPEGFPRDMWSDLKTPERYYVRMLDMEARGSAKVADFQNFAKSFAYGDYKTLMGSTIANAASLAGAADLKGRMLEGEGFATTQLRQVLFAIWKTMEGDALDPKRGVTILKTEYAADYWARRLKLIAQASYVALKTKTTRPDESAAAEELAEALKLDRV
jgi:putative DNA methylase